MPDQTIPTLEDVARLAEVSTATVSRCLNSPERVVAKTRERVLAAVEALGYAPNFGARALAAKRTNTVGAVIPTMENAIFARGIQAFQEELQRHGVTLLVASSSYQPDVEAAQIRNLTSRGADGLLLIGHDRSAELYQFLQSRNLPVLVAWAYDPAMPNVSIGFDNRAAMGELADEVIRLGHRRIGVISAMQQGNDRARARVQGIRDAAARHGLDPDAIQVIETAYSIENGAEALGRLLDQPVPPTVVMCGNDVLAVGAITRAKELGISVPGQLSITGFDDIELATVIDPALTTVHVPHREMGRRAAGLLVDMIKGGPQPESIRLLTRICMRGTLAPPPE